MYAERQHVAVFRPQREGMLMSWFLAYFEHNAAHGRHAEPMPDNALYGGAIPVRYISERLNGMVLCHRLDARDFFAFGREENHFAAMGNTSRRLLTAFLRDRLLFKEVTPYLYTFICHGSTWPTLVIDADPLAVAIDLLPEALAGGPREGDFWRIDAVADWKIASSRAVQPLDGDKRRRPRKGHKG